MEIKRLIEIGLTKNQAEVYLELIKNPEQTGGGISKSLSLDRSFSYNILDSLIEKGLVNYVEKENKRLFFPSDPENLLKEIEEKRDKIEEIVKEIKTIKKLSKKERSVRVYEGKAGLKAYVRDLIESKEFFTLGGGGKLDILESLKYEYPHYLKKLSKKKVKGKLITSPENKKTMNQMYKNYKVDIKSLKNLKNPSSLAIFKNKVAIYYVEDKPFVVIIEDKKIAEFFKMYFTHFWKLVKTK